MDTIVAISSATGPAARMIVRASGPLALSVSLKLSGVDSAHASAVRSVVTFQGLSVPACVLSFHGPRSYTGEDLVEWHLPGNPILARLLIRECLDRGGPGRAGGVYLTRLLQRQTEPNEAEGVAVSIAAASEAELQASRQPLRANWPDGFGRPWK